MHLAPLAYPKALTEKTVKCAEGEGYRHLTGFEGSATKTKIRFCQLSLYTVEVALRLYNYRALWFNIIGDYYEVFSGY